MSAKATLMRRLGLLAALASLLFGSVACSANDAADPSPSDRVSSSAQTDTSNALYVPATTEEEREASDALEQKNLFDDVSEVQRSLEFRALVPADTAGRDLKGFRLLGTSEKKPDNMIVIHYDRLQINQERASSVAEAEQRVEQVAFRGLGAFDDRFMVKVKVRGFEGIAWHPVSIRQPELDSRGQMVRPGIEIETAGLVWSEGQQVFALIASDLDYQKLILVAESMK